MDRDRRAVALLSTYPRMRPELPPAQRASYVEHYKLNRSGERGLSRVVVALEQWMHRRATGTPSGGAILEIGAGNLNHVPYEPDAPVYDVVEPFEQLWQQSPYLPRLRRIYADILEVPERERYDTVVSIAVLEHLTDLPLILARAGLLLREGGSFRAGFPSEGGLLWGLAWRLTTGVEYRLRRGLDYGAIMRHEHVNTAAEILALLEYFYRSVAVSRYPLPSSHFSFYTTAIARQPHEERCRDYCAERARPASARHG